MPEILRANLPPALLRHLLDRIRQRNIAVDQLGLLADWLDHFRPTSWQTFFVIKRILSGFVHIECPSTTA